VSFQQTAPNPERRMIGVLEGLRVLSPPCPARAQARHPFGPCRSLRLRQEAEGVPLRLRARGRRAAPPAAQPPLHKNCRSGLRLLYHHPGRPSILARIIHERCRARVAPPQPERARAKWDPFGLLPQFDELREGPNG